MSTSSTIRSYFNKFRQWKNNGASPISIFINGFLLTLIWIVVPLEREPWLGFRQRFASLYPQINPIAPKAFDSVRFIVQSLFLLFYKSSATPSSLQRAFGLFITKVQGALRRLSQIIAHYGALFLEGNQRGLEQIGQHESVLPASLKIIVLWGLGLIALGLATLCITQPFNIQGQVLFLSVMLILAFALSQIKARLTLMLLFVISMVVSGRYLWWRCTTTVNTDSAIGWILSILLLLAEIYAFIVMLLGYFQVCWVLDRKPYPLPDDQAEWPHVDIFIPTYNEALEVIKPTVFATMNMQWPAEKLHIYILDDGSRDAFAEFAREVGVGYIKRKEHNHAKAGNINHAMTVTHGEFITIFDCDHVPSSDFLVKTVGWLVKDKNIALVQTPHHFYSPDPFEKNWHLNRATPIENALFHDFIQKGNDTWNATMFCGSSAVMRRCALEQIGGIAVETVTEDAHTSLKLNRLGWSSAFIDTPLASGLSTETLAAHIGQRIRWARGMIQIFRLDNPFLGKGLTLAQRLCFFNAMFHFLHGLPRLIFLVAPLPYMFGNIYVIYATATAIFAYVVPHMVHTALTNFILQRGYRYPFMGGVYETVLSWYILLPTTVALFMPHKGKFNVTAKGGTIGEKYLDWPITKPFLFLIALNVLGLGIGFYKAIFSPEPEYLTLAINMGWIAYNLTILGASMAVAVEEVQTHRFPRVDCNIEAQVSLAGNECLEMLMKQYSQDEVLLIGSFPSSIKVGDAAQLRLVYQNQTYSFGASVISSDPQKGLELRLEFTNFHDERAFNRCTFSREGMWATVPDKIDDRMSTGFKTLVSLALYGYRSMIEFLPPSWKWIQRLIGWFKTLLPRVPYVGK